MKYKRKYILDTTNIGNKMKQCENKPISMMHS